MYLLIQFKETIFQKQFRIIGVLVLAVDYKWVGRPMAKCYGDV